MKLAMTLNYTGNFRSDVQLIQDLERAGLDLAWVPEAYSFDSISQIGYLAAVTSTIQLGTGIINVYSRTATAVGQTAAGCDYVTDGRFVLGIGASGPQVIEGFHGVAYDKPMARIIDYINVVRMVLRREPVVYDGATVQLPLPADQGTGLGKPLKLINHPRRSSVPIFWAAVKGKSVANTARHADGWLPIFFDPTRFADIWGADLNRGLAERDAGLGPLEIIAGGLLASATSTPAPAPMRCSTSPGRAMPCTSAGWAPAARTSTPSWLLATAIPTRRSRSRTATSLATRRRRPSWCPASYWRTPT